MTMMYDEEMKTKITELVLNAIPVIESSIFLLLPLGSIHTMELSLAFFNKVSNNVKIK